MGAGLEPLEQEYAEEATHRGSRAEQPGEAGVVGLSLRCIGSESLQGVPHACDRSEQLGEVGAAIGAVD